MKLKSFWSKKHLTFSGFTIFGETKILPKMTEGNLPAYWT
jgi:hypothetical protein